MEHIKAGTYTLEKCYSPDYASDWPEELQMTITEQGAANIAKAFAFMDENPAVSSVSLDVNYIDPWKAGLAVGYPDSMPRLGVEKLAVYAHGGMYLDLQSEYDCADCAEYQIVDEEQNQ